MQIAAVTPPVPVSAPAAARARPDAAVATEQRGSDAQGPAGESGPPQGQRGPLDLSEAERALVQQLQQRDRAVRAHELAHVAAGGQYVTSPANYQYQVGPDGRRYAVGGEVSIDTSVPADPEEALAKAEVIERAALAPVDPSPQDYRVAARARQMAAEARRELAAEQLEERTAGEGSERFAADAPAAEERAPRVLPLETEQALAPRSSFSLRA